MKLNITRVGNELLADGGTDPTFVERLAAARAAHAWVAVHAVEAVLARLPTGHPAATAVGKQLGMAERRLQAALKGLPVNRF